MGRCEITMEVSGWVEVSLTIFYFFKSSKKSPMLVRIFWGSIPCVLCGYNNKYMLLKVVSHYDMNVLSMSVMGFPKKQSLDKARGGFGELYPFCWEFF